MPSAPYLLCHEDLPTISDLMLSDWEYSFANQLHKQYQEGQQAFVVTANSAIPIADSVRGFYEEAGVYCPLINFVRVNNRTRRAMGGYRELVEIEAARLCPDLTDIKQACVVDQFVLSG